MDKAVLAAEAEGWTWKGGFPHVPLPSRSGRGSGSCWAGTQDQGISKMDKEERSCFPKKTKEERSLPFAAILDSVDMERAEVL